MIHFRSLTPGEEEEAYNIIASGYNFVTMPHIKWRFMDNPSWDYEYSAVGEVDKKIVAVSFLERQSMKILDGTIEVLVGGAGAVHPDYRRRGYYKKMNAWNIAKTRSLKIPLFAAYVVRNDITYPTLKKEGFFPFTSQHHYMKILNVKKTFILSLEMLNALPLPALSLHVRIIPQGEDPFVLQMEKGTFSISADAPRADIVLSGDIKTLIPLLANKRIVNIFALWITKKVTIRIRCASLLKVLTLFRVVVRWR